jgi:hypothetical protein
MTVEVEKVRKRLSPLLGVGARVCASKGASDHPQIDLGNCSFKEEGKENAPAEQGTMVLQAAW